MHSFIHLLQTNLFTELQRNPSVQNAFLKNNASKLSHLQWQKYGKTRTEITHWGEWVGREMKKQELHSFIFWVTDCEHKHFYFVNFKQGVFTSPLQKNWKNPTVTRTTTWKGIDPPGNGVPGAAESPNSRAKPVPDLHSFSLCRQSIAMLIFVCRRTAKQLLFLSPPLPSKVTENSSC